MQYGVERIIHQTSSSWKPFSGESIIGNQPVQDELAFQLDMAMKTAARDIEHSLYYKEPMSLTQTYGNS